MVGLVLERRAHRKGGSWDGTTGTVGIGVVALASPVLVRRALRHGLGSGTALSHPGLASDPSVLKVV